MFFDPLAERAIRRLIGDIEISAESISGYLAGMSYEDFANDRRTIGATERELLLIAEALSRIENSERKAELADEFRLQQRVPEIRLHEIRGMGNIIRHGYDRINVSELWSIATGSSLRDLVDALHRAYP